MKTVKSGTAIIVEPKRTAQKGGPMSDLIDRQAAIEAIESITSSMSVCINKDECHGMKRMQRQAVNELANIPSAQPTLYRYDIEYLEVIADVLRKENLSPERIAEWLMDIDRIIAIVRDEFAETLRWVLQD